MVNQNDGYLHKLSLLTGTLCILVGLIVGIGWHLRSTLLIQISPDFSPMQFNTALSFVLTGLSLVFYYYRKFALKAFCGMLLVALSLSSFFFYISGLKGTIFGSGLANMAVHISFLFLILGFILCYMALKKLKGYSSRKEWLLPAYIFLCGMILTLCFKMALEAHQRLLLNRTFSVQAEEIAHLFSLRNNNVQIRGANIQETMEEILSIIGDKGFALTVLDSNNIPIFSTEPSSEIYDEELHGDARVSDGKRTLKITIKPTRDFVKANKSQLPLSIFVIGLVISGLTAWIAHANQELSKSRLHLEKTYRSLVSREKQLRGQKDLLHHILENSDAYIYVKDLHGKYLLANSKFRSGVGYIHSLVGKNDDEIFGEDTAKILQHNDKEVLAKKKKMIFEETVPIGSESRTFMSFKAPIFDSEGNLSGVCGISTDITSRAEAENRLKQSFIALEETNKQLIGARKIAEEANKAKSTFLVNMSHEIRTPLNGMIGLTELLYNTELSEKQERFVEKISESGQILLSLISDLIDYSKIETGGLELDVASCNIKELLEDILTTMSVKASQKGLSMQLQMEEKIPKELRLDAARLKQVLFNLIDNAIKFTEQGGITITCAFIKHQEASAPKKILRFEVIDTGIGIPEGKKDILFEKFTQVDSSSTRKYSGSGLGLAFCKKLINLMGGEIGFHSIEGHGSTFWFEIPIAFLEETTDNPPFENSLSKTLC